MKKKELTQLELTAITALSQENIMLCRLIEYLVYKTTYTLEGALEALKQGGFELIPIKEYLLIYKYVMRIERCSEEAAHAIVINSEETFAHPRYSRFLSYLACNGDMFAKSNAINAEVYESIFNKMLEDQALFPPKDQQGKMLLEYAKEHKNDLFIEIYTKMLDQSPFSPATLEVMFEYYNQYFANDVKYGMFAAALRTDKYLLQDIIDHFKNKDVQFSFMQYAQDASIDVLKELHSKGVMQMIPSDVVHILCNYYTYIYQDNKNCFKDEENADLIVKNIQTKLEKIESALKLNEPVMLDISKDGKKLLHFLVEYCRAINIEGSAVFEEVSKLIKYFHNAGLCIDHKTAIFSEDEKDLLALELAFRYSQTELIKFFATELYNGELQINDEDSLLHNAICYGNIEIIEFLVKTFKFDVNSIQPIRLCNKEQEVVGDVNFTALTLALHYERYEVAEKLLELGADINVTDPGTGVAFAHLLCSCGEFKTLEFMVKKGLDVNIKDKSGDTILHYLSVIDPVFHPSLTSIIEVLRKAGADFYSKNNAGETAIFNASKNQCVRIFTDAIWKSAKEKSESTKHFIVSIDKNEEQDPTNEDSMDLQLLSGAISELPE